MKDTLLIIFGCSWTYGIGAGYDEKMDERTYNDKIRWSEELCYEHSWRKIVLDYYDLKSINFSVGGSSNKKQFKYARDFFISYEWQVLKEKYKKVVVLWGITTTERTYMWHNAQEKYIDLFLHKFAHPTKKLFTDSVIKVDPNNDKSISEFITKISYNYKNEVNQLTNEMLFWNEFFTSNNIQNIWFDTFDSHEYTKPIKNLIDYDKEKRDLLYFMCKNHKELLNIDSACFNTKNYFEYALKYKLLNPYSYHPTKSQYKLIGDYFIEKLNPYLTQ